jgi:glycerol-3-phosphate O-acyltransferase
MGFFGHELSRMSWLSRCTTQPFENVRMRVVGLEMDSLRFLVELVAAECRRTQVLDKARSKSASNESAASPSFC